MEFVSHLESALDGTEYVAGTVQTMHRDRPLWVRYDLDAVKGEALEIQAKVRLGATGRLVFLDGEVVEVEDIEDAATFVTSVFPTGQNIIGDDDVRFNPLIIAVEQTTIQKWYTAVKSLIVAGVNTSSILLV